MRRALIAAAIGGTILVVAQLVTEEIYNRKIEAAFRDIDRAADDAYWYDEWRRRTRVRVSTFFIAAFGVTALVLSTTLIWG